MALTDAQWADAVATAVSRFHTGVTTESQMSAEIAAATNDWPTRTLSNADLAYRISRSLANLTGLTETSGPPDPNMGTLGAMAFDKDALAFYGPKTEAGWGDARPLDAGPAGPSVELQNSGGFIQWRVEGDATWTNLIATSELDGTDGREVQIQASATHIQWRYVGDAAWIDIVALSSLVGPKGDKGDTGNTGLTGNAAWTPVFAVVVDGARRVQQITDWTGGGGTKPAVGKYVGPTGLVDTAALATDIRGAGGSGSGDMIAANNLSDLTNMATARTNLSVYSIAQVDTALGLKADKSTTYTKTEVDTALSGKQASLGFTPEDVAKKGAVNGYAGLGADGKVPAVQLPTPTAASSVAEIRAGSGSGYVSPANGKAAQDYVVITRASAAGGLDFDTFNNASITLDANLTVSGWINSYPGKSGRIRFIQNGTGGFTVAWAAGYIVPASFSLQATANGVTDVPYVCEADNKIRLYNPSKWVA